MIISGFSEAALFFGVLLVTVELLATLPFPIDFLEELLSLSLAEEDEVEMFAFAFGGEETIWSSSSLSSSSESEPASLLSEEEEESESSSSSSSSSSSVVVSFEVEAGVLAGTEDLELGVLTEAEVEAEVEADFSTDAFFSSAGFFSAGAFFFFSGAGDLEKNEDDRLREDVQHEDRVRIISVTF